MLRQRSTETQIHCTKATGRLYQEILVVQGFSERMETDIKVAFVLGFRRAFFDEIADIPLVGD